MDYIRMRASIILGGLFSLIMLTALSLAGFAAPYPSYAQSTDETREVAYGETVSGILSPENREQEWVFGGEERDLVQLTVRRISGQFTPRVSLLSTNGIVIEPTSVTSDQYEQDVLFQAGLQADGPYIIQVSGENLAAVIDNPAEYSLTLTWIGRNPANVYLGLRIPTVGLTSLNHAVESGAPEVRNDERSKLGVEIYGSVSVTRPESGSKPANFFLNSHQHDIQTLFNGNVISHWLRSISFLDEGIGLTTIEGQTFFADQSITLLENEYATVSITLANGQLITTDFFNLVSIEAIDDLIVARTIADQRIVLSGHEITLVEQDGLLYITYDNQGGILTDMAGWHTIAYLPAQNNPGLSVLFEGDWRLLIDHGFFRLVQEQAEVPLWIENREDVVLPLAYVAEFDTAPDDTVDVPVPVRIDPRGIGTIEWQTDQIVVHTLDERVLNEPLATLESVWIEDRAVQCTRTDNSRRLSLPDGTLIDMPGSFEPIETALPGEVGYLPHGHNKLGAALIPTYPQVNVVEMPEMFNPVNGNFRYMVQDFFTDGYTLPLDFTRYYNSLAQVTTPGYMLAAPDGYLFAQIGSGWRHSYQIELDLTRLQLGQIELVLPDGTRHVFSQRDLARPRFRSLTLSMWTIDRLSGETGQWIATRTDGYTYAFDRAGRLQRITDTNRHSLTFSPVPRFYREDASAAAGFFAIEPYGRRQEVYANADGYIFQVRHADSFDIVYDYGVDHTLVGVTYPELSATATYGYAEGQITSVNDVRSPYHQTLQLAYDERRRLVEFTENPTGTPRAYRYSYGELTTTQSLVVNGEARVWRWEFSPAHLITRHELPGFETDNEWRYEYEYTADNPNHISSHRQPGGRHLTFIFNEYGHLEVFLDPIYTNGEQTVINYEIFDDDRQLRIKDIKYGSGDYDLFEYDEQSRVIAHLELIQPGYDIQEHTTGYEYDEQGRIAAVRTAGPSGEDVFTRYIYDDFGYVSEISSGNGSRTVQTVYDRLGLLRSVIDGRGNPISLEWSPSGRSIIGLVDQEGVRTRYEYDPYGNLTSIDYGGAITLVTYNDLNQPSSINNPLSEITRYKFDEVGNVLEVVRGNGVSMEQYTYDKQNYLRMSSTADGLVTTYNTRWERVSADANAESTGRLIREHINPAGESTRYVYDALGRLSHIIEADVLGHDTYVYEFGYLGQNNLATIQRSSGVRAFENLIEFNYIGQPIASTVTGQRTQYTYNPAGWVAAVIESDGRETTYTYDLLGNVTRVTLPGDDSSPSPVYEYSYDENGNMVTATNPLGFTTRYVYDELNRLITILDPMEQQTSFGYDSRGNLTSVTDPNRVVHEARYSAADQVTATLNGLGNSTSYEYDSLGRLVKITAPHALFYEEYTYDPNDNIIAISYPGERRILYNYDVLGRVTGVMDALGHTTIYSYNQLGKVDQVIDPLGYHREYDWRSDGKLLQQISPSGNRHEYALDNQGRITRITNHSAQDGNNSVYIIYDDAGNIIDVEFASGETTKTSASLHYEFTYTPQGWPLTVTDPGGSTWGFTHNLAGWLTQVRDPAGILQTIEYDQVGRPIKRVFALGTEIEQSETFSYDANGNVTRYVDPNGLVSEFVYDANGHLKQQIEGANTDTPRTHLFEYDELGDLISIQNPAGNLTEFRYDFGRVIAQVKHLKRDDAEAQTVTTTYEYDKVGNLSSMTLPEGNTVIGENLTDKDFQTNMTYNALNLRVRYIDAEDKVWTYTYDADHNLLQTGDPLGNTTYYEYDSSGRVQRIIFPTGATVQLKYDIAGNFNAVVGPETEIRQSVGENNETIGSEKPTITYQLDVMGNLVLIEDIDLSQTYFSYDKLGQLTSRTRPDGTKTTYAYDELGRLIERVAPEGTVTWRYGADHRPLEIKAGADRYLFDYTPFGEVKMATGPGLTIKYEADSLGRTVQRDADRFGQTTYEYDSLDRLTRVETGDAFATFDYNLNGWLTNITRSNGVSTQYGYNTNGAMTRITHRGPTGVVDLWTYSYDDASNITRINRQDSWTTLFSYDASNHLIDERWLNPDNRAEYAANFRYDASGNLVEKMVSSHGQLATRTLFVYDRENQLIAQVRNYEPIRAQGVTNGMALVVLLLLGGAVVWRIRRGVFARNIVMVAGVVLLSSLVLNSVSAQSIAAPYRIDYEYDQQGNLAHAKYPAETGADVRYQYDSENRLVRVSGINESGEKLDTRLTYDPFNRLMRLQTIENDLRLYYDERTLLGYEEANTGARYAFIEPLSGLQLLKQLPDGTFQWMIRDGQNSVRQMMGDEVTGTSIEYNSFGEIILPYGPEQQQALPELPVKLYGGMLYEPTTGLYISSEQRVYDPQLARYLQRDFVRHDPRATLYTYQYNHPNVTQDFQAKDPSWPAQTTSFSDRITNLPTISAPPPEFDLPYAQYNDIGQLSSLVPNETARVMTLMRRTQFEMNETPGSLDPMLRDFYILGVNPQSPNIKSMQFPWQNNIIELYNGGWNVLAAPTPYEVSTARAYLEALTGPILQANARPFDWYGTAETNYLPLPDDVIPDALAAHVRDERSFLTMLQEPVMLPQLNTELGNLWEIAYPAGIEVPRPNVDIPDPLISFPILTHINNLRAQQIEFYQTNQQVGPLIP